MAKLNTATIQQKWQRPKQAAVSLGVTLQTLGIWKRKGLIGFSKIGGASYYDVGTFIETLERTNINATSSSASINIEPKPSNK